VLLFADGRAIVRGTVDPVAARRVYAKYVGPEGMPRSGN